MRLYAADFLTTCIHGSALACGLLPVAVAARAATDSPTAGIAVTVTTAVLLLATLRWVLAPRLPRLDAWFRLRKAVGRHRHDTVLGVDDRVLLFIYRRPARGVMRIDLDEEARPRVDRHGVGMADTVWAMDFGLIVRRKDGCHVTLEADAESVLFTSPPVPPLSRLRRWSSVKMAVHSGIAFPDGPELEVLLDQLARARPLPK